MEKLIIKKFDKQKNDEWQAQIEKILNGDHEEIYKKYHHEIYEGGELNIFYLHHLTTRIGKGFIYQQTALPKDDIIALLFLTNEITKENIDELYTNLREMTYKHTAYIKTLVIEFLSKIINKKDFNILTKIVEENYEIDETMYEELAKLIKR